ncbi:hypothetical protein SAMN05444008_101418 [Cnuella takakiae]|uniref:DUF922 domain-containing protein n=1 Tax=Cnuella takakiae TaxID=1302690 RepID=A0A1M4TIW2_9BACT|nr:hypothetical protein [Cnuella takakiae]SHE44411.1 hypothetical protein SAMN05444008_101418 [Cnuella takakiae]
MQTGFHRWMGMVVLSMVCSGGLRAQQSGEAKLLYWSPERRLSFDDFGGRRKTGDTIFIYRNAKPDVHRLGTISTAIDVHVKKERKRTTFTIRAVMNANASWIRAEGDSITLRHEQGHFDITEIYTRVMRREMRKARSHKDSETIYEAVLAAESAEHAQYDAANTFENGGITRAWSDQIARRLKALAPYNNPKLVHAWDK